MKLFYSGNSPYARRTRVAAMECGLGDTVEHVDITTLGGEGHPLLQHGPGAKVPALMTDAGTFLCETLIITRFLNEQGDGSLLPAQGKESILALEGVGSLLMDSLFVRAMENRREPGERSPAFQEKESDRCARCYDELAKMLAGEAASVNLGTIAAVCSLGYADWRHPEDDWRQGRDELTAWFDAMMAIGSVGDTRPIY